MGIITITRSPILSFWCLECKVRPRSLEATGSQQISRFGSSAQSACHFLLRCSRRFSPSIALWSQPREVLSPPPFPWQQPWRPFISSWKGWCWRLKLPSRDAQQRSRFRGCSEWRYQSWCWGSSQSDSFQSLPDLAPYAAYLWNLWAAIDLQWGFAGTTQGCLKGLGWMFWVWLPLPLRNSKG